MKSPSHPCHGQVKKVQLISSITNLNKCVLIVCEKGGLLPFETATHETVIFMLVHACKKNSFNHHNFDTEVKQLNFNAKILFFF